MSEHLRNHSAAMADLLRWADEGRLYAILDACDSPEILAKVRSLPQERVACLYRGEIPKEIEEVAPYLAHADDLLVRWLAETLWDQPWGIFLVAEADLPGLRKHLRKLLVVESPEREPLYFRYYDPRILPPFLDSCSGGEIRTVYGPVLAFGVCAKDQGQFLITTPC